MLAKCTAWRCHTGNTQYRATAIIFNSVKNYIGRTERNKEFQDVNLSYLTM